MFENKPPESPNGAIEHGAQAVVQTADHAIESGRRATQQALHGVSESIHQLRDEAVPLVNRAAEQASLLGRRGADALYDGAAQVRGSVRRLSDDTRHYIRVEPIKSVLIAAAAGAALAGLVGMLSRHRQHR